MAGTEALNQMLSADNTKLQLRNKELLYQVDSQREAFKREYQALQQEVIKAQSSVDQAKKLKIESRKKIEEAETRMAGADVDKFALDNQLKDLQERSEAEREELRKASEAEQVNQKKMIGELQDQVIDL